MPYRTVSRAMLETALLFGPAERLGLDELFIDVTGEVEKRTEAIQRRRGSGQAEEVTLSGHVHRASQAVASDRFHRAQDLRVVQGMASEQQCAALEAGIDCAEAWAGRLAIGSQIAAEIRAAIKSNVGIRTSGGIACNKALAKLVSGLHKPDDQTLLLPSEVAAFISPLRVRVLLGIGRFRFFLFLS